MKMIIAISVLGMALLFGCQQPYYPPPIYQPPQPPQFGANEPAPYVAPTPLPKEDKLLISNAKILFITDDTVAIEFNTNVPASSTLSLTAGEKVVSSSSITAKTTYHYYKFTGLKQITFHYAIIKAQSETSDDKTITFTTQGKIEPNIPQPQQYCVPPYYTPYYPPTYVPPVPSGASFWDGTVVVIVTP